MKNKYLIRIILGFMGAVADATMADEPADQIERAQLLRDLLESRPSTDGPALRGPRIESVRPPVPAEALHRQQLEEAQWRSLIGSQQVQINAPASQSISQGQWRGQILDRERQAQDLSADILRRSQEWTNGRR